MTKTSGSKRVATLAEQARAEQLRKEKLKRELIPLVARGTVKQADAATTLNMTDRQVRRLLTKYKEEGEAALAR
jgi:transposase